MKRLLLSLLFAAVLLAQFAFQITTHAALPGATAGMPYTVTLSAAGGTAPYLWFQASPGLPPGLTMTADGVISGTPTASGTYAIRLFALDSSGAALNGGLITGAAEADQIFTLTVN